ncbi:hypothetical protein A2837_00790 [Candidatus Kaiserbacteria bacterium RIFCSPHIGHO2_01_FULL_46_22]|uniref:Uncharacterized protein n=1 Tax=Candidatus Kaiserbacteria bacterium RIFCSPHIGHO2_01_FULL_46_22 TaxID=1798475 RepID=A0A1F6BXR6_9BACT|nr:MAG: hypothetical protein A2837_00790 [Candidatus Kaiserbacteria bacterium RIFCSPHIGHO2_01_FULL_46_22]
MAKSKKSGISGGEKVGIGVALTTAAVAAAGAYFLYGSPNAAKNRKKVKSWTLKAKGEVLEVLEKAGKMSAEEYQQAVEAISAGYSKVQSVSKADIADFKKEMMANWQKIAKQAAPAKKAAKKAVKKAVKKATK